MDFYEVLEAFAELSGQREDVCLKQGAELRLAMEEVEAQLRPQAEIAGKERLLSRLAAAIAYERCAVLWCGAGSSVRTADVQVSFDAQAQLAHASETVRRLHLQAQPLLRDRDFLFRSM